MPSLPRPFPTKVWYVPTHLVPAFSSKPWANLVTTESKKLFYLVNVWKPSQGVRRSSSENLLQGRRVRHLQVCNKRAGNAVKIIVRLKKKSDRKLRNLALYVWPGSHRLTESISFTCTSALWGQILLLVPVRVANIEDGCFLHSPQLLRYDPRMATSAGLEVYITVQIFVLKWHVDSPILKNIFIILIIWLCSVMSCMQDLWSPLCPWGIF